MPRITAAPHSGNRFDTKAWCRYRPLIKRWMDEFPNTFEFEATQLSPETITSRMRDAVRGYITFNWPPADVNHDRLTEVWEQTYLSAGDGRVKLYSTFGQKDAMVGLDCNEYVFTIKAPTKPELIAALLLANNNRLNSKPVSILDLPTDLIPFINSNDIDDNFPNVVITSKDRTNYTIL